MKYYGVHSKGWNKETKRHEYEEVEEEFEFAIGKQINCEEATSIEITPGRWITVIPSEWATIMMDNKPVTFKSLKEA